MQAAKTPGLTKKEHGELPRSGFRPSAKARPVPSITCIAGSEPANPDLVNVPQGRAKDASADQGRGLPLRDGDLDLQSGVPSGDPSGRFCLFTARNG